MHPDAQGRAIYRRTVAMRICVAASLIALGIGCATPMRGPGMVETQVITYPDGALVEFNGESKGRAPAKIVLPQDEHGRLTERAVVRIIPNTAQPTLFAQNRVFEPTERTDRVPNRIFVDMTLPGTNSIASGRAPTTHVEKDTEKSVRPPVPYTERGKPTQAVGLDRWKPGIY
jgi:hypothetical protein